MRPRTTLLGVTFASSLYSFGMQTSEFRSRRAGALGGIKGRLRLSLEVGHDVAGDQLEALGGRLRVRPIVAAEQQESERTGRQLAKTGAPRRNLFRRCKHAGRRF